MYTEIGAGDDAGDTTLAFAASTDEEADRPVRIRAPTRARRRTGWGLFMGRLRDGRVGFRQRELDHK
jgi:hypothetical protein